MNISKDLIKPLAPKTIQYDEWFLENHSEKVQVINRVLSLDPTELYERISQKIDPFKRHQGIQVDDLFPKLEGKCACGCDVVPRSFKNGSNEKYAKNTCKTFVNDVVSIINNYFQKPSYYITKYYGKKCSECDEKDFLELDHIVGVKHGGGGSWLSNYRWLCRKHHVHKTNESFGHKRKDKTQLKIELLNETNK